MKIFLNDASSNKTDILLVKDRIFDNGETEKLLTVRLWSSQKKSRQPQIPEKSSPSAPPPPAPIHWAVMTESMNKIIIYEFLELMSVNLALKKDRKNIKVVILFNVIFVKNYGNKILFFWSAPLIPSLNTFFLYKLKKKSTVWSKIYVILVILNDMLQLFVLNGL